MGRGLLILVAGLVIIVGIVQKSITERLKFLPERTSNYHQEMDAQNIANSLMEYGIRELDNNQEWTKGYSSSDFMGAEAELEVFTYDDFTNGNSNIPDDHSIENWDQYTILLVSTVITTRTKAVTEVSITKDSFSKYTYFTNNEPSNIYFYDEDVFNGPVHTNSQMNIAGSPTFNGFVSSPQMWEGRDSDSEPILNGGSDFSSKVKEMPSPEVLNLLRNQGQNGGLTFDSDIEVEFNQDGTVDIAEYQNDSWQSPVTYDLANYNGIISSSKKVSTKGTLKGQVTLHSAEQVEIMGDLTYATDPTSNPDSEDLLGIVSEGDVIVDEHAHEQSPDNQDLNIHASIMALDQSFEVENYGSGDPRGAIKLLGGLQQETRGAVGTFSGDQIQSGYSKEYTYDSRLASEFPPFYPRESIYSQQYWKEKPVEFL